MADGAAAETVKTDSDGAGKRSFLGRCRHFFWLGVLFDTVGVVVQFIGVFADVYYYDMLLYLGSLIIFFGLLWWVSWYSSNIELLPEDASKKTNTLPAFSVMEFLGHNLGQRITHNLASAVSQSFGQIRPKRRRRLRVSMPRTASQSTGVADQMEKDGEEEKMDDQDFDGETPGPEPEKHRSSAAASSLGPGAGGTTHLGSPLWTPPPPDPQPPSRVLASKSLPTVPVASASQPASTPASRSQMVFPSASVSRPAVISAWTSRAAVPRASLSHPLVSEVAQQPPQSRNQSSEVQTSGVQSPATNISVTASGSDQSFQTVSSLARHSPRDFQPAPGSQQASQTSSLVQESSRSQTSAVPASPEKPVAQDFETQLLSSQKQFEKLLDTPSPVPEAADTDPKASESVGTNYSPTLDNSEEEFV